MQFHVALVGCGSSATVSTREISKVSWLESIQSFTRRFNPATSLSPVSIWEWVRAPKDAPRSLRHAGVAAILAESSQVGNVTLEALKQMGFKMGGSNAERYTVVKAVTEMLTLLKTTVPARIMRIGLPR